MDHGIRIVDDTALVRIDGNRVVSDDTEYLQGLIDEGYRVIPEGYYCLGAPLEFRKPVALIGSIVYVLHDGPAIRVTHPDVHIALTAFRGADDRPLPPDRDVIETADGITLDPTRVHDNHGGRISF